MGFLLRVGSYLFHPLFMPLLGWVLYIIIQPVHPKALILQYTYKDVLLFTLIIPALFWSYLKLRNRISDWDVEKVKERSIPLLLYSLCIMAFIYLAKLNYILPYKAFVYGILTSVITCWILTLIKVKVSLHQLGISGLLIFVICLSIYFQINLLLYISILFIANGWVASSRLYLKKHSPIELGLGFVLGALPQLYLVTYWL